MTLERPPAPSSLDPNDSWALPIPSPGASGRAPSCVLGASSVLGVEPGRLRTQAVPNAWQLTPRGEEALSGLFASTNRGAVPSNLNEETVR
jgi:hypothetical protein